MVHEMVDRVPKCIEAACGVVDLGSRADAPGSIEFDVLRLRQCLPQLGGICVEIAQERLRRLEAVAGPGGEIEVDAFDNVRHHLRHSAAELREMPERRGPGVRLPGSFVTRDALDQTAARLELRLDLLQKSLANCHGRLSELNV